MADAKFEVYGPDGSLWFSSADRVLRVLTVSDLNPSETTLVDPEISPQSAIPQTHYGAPAIVTNGSITYTDAVSSRPPVIMY